MAGPSIVVPAPETFFDAAALREQVQTLLGSVSDGKRGKFVAYTTLDGKAKLLAVQKIGDSWIIGGGLAADLRRGIKGGLAGGLYIGGEW